MNAVLCSWMDSGKERSEGTSDLRGQDDRENGASEMWAWCCVLSFVTFFFSIFAGKNLPDKVKCDS